MAIAWIASRTIRSGKMAAFRKAWQSRAALARYRRTAAERARLAAMKPLVKRVNWAGVYDAEDVRL